MWRHFREFLVRWAVAGALLTAAVTLPLQAQTLTVAIDSSLAVAMQAVVRDFEAQRPGRRVMLELGASGVLLEQIAQGQPADVLAGPDLQTMELGEQRRVLLPAQRSAFATNTLVLVVPAMSKLPVQRLSDLARPEVARIALGRPASVPAGRYAREAINAQRLWSALQRKTLIAEDLREVIEWVARSDVEAGFVYASDVAAATAGVRVVETLATATPIRHFAAVVASSRNPALAGEFVAYLRSNPAQSLFKQVGFGVP